MKNKFLNSKMPKRMTAALMAGVLLSGTCQTQALAGAPQVQTDESVYVNMDYYGAIQDIDIVKGCLLNGNTTIEDYGTYDDVINMSNRVQPTIADGKVTWDLSGTDSNKFYYECKAPQLQSNLPWTFDVTYKLNGVEQKGEDLAGANGLVTIDINATANKDADEYYKNNMILMCGTGVDMDSTLSIEAPGAQLQTFGTMKGVIFMALPGEDSDFQINIGSEDFECYGVFFMMVPATLSSLDMISDVREVKDKTRDSFDAISDATDALVDSVTSMKDDMQSLKSGAQAAQAAKNTYDDNRDSIKTDADAAIDSLETLSDYLTVLNNQAEVSEDDLVETMERIDAINKTVNGMRDYYDDVDDNVGSMKNNVRDIRDVVSGTVTEQGLIDLAYLLEGSTASTLTQDGLGSAVSSKTQQAIAGLGAYGGYTENKSMSNVGLAQLLKTYMAELKDVGDDPMLGALVDSEELLDRAQDILDKIDSVLAQTNTLSNFATGQATDDTLALCDQVEELINVTSVSLITVQSALKTMRYTLDAVEPSMDTAINSTLNGFIGLMDSGMNMTDSMGLVKDAKDVMKDAIDDELDEIEDDSNILNLDTEAEFPSFTSDKNATPTSIQIIMRTAEISKDDDTDNSVDIEKEPVDLGVLGRLKAIFVKIWDGITGIFN